MSNISVSEDKIKALLADFKLELVQELKAFATTAAMEMIDARVKVLELWQANVIGAATNQRKVTDRTLAWAALLVAIVAPAVVAVVAR